MKTALLILGSMALTIILQDIVLTTKVRAYQTCAIEAWIQQNQAKMTECQTTATTPTVVEEVLYARPYFVLLTFLGK